MPTRTIEESKYWRAQRSKTISELKEMKSVKEGCKRIEKKINVIKDFVLN